jgi:predicted transposase YdaD
LRRRKSQKDKEELNMLAQTNPDVKKAVVKLIELSADDKAKMLHEARIKESRIQYARDALVREEGRKEALLNVARSALKKNISVEDIMALTGLTSEEIQGLPH